MLNLIQIYCLTLKTVSVPIMSNLIGYARVSTQEQELQLQLDATFAGLPVSMQFLCSSLGQEVNTSDNEY